MTVMRTMTLYRRGDDRATIFLEGEIDLTTAPAVGQAVQDCLRRGASSVDVDLARLAFCDASGVNLFLAVARHADTTGTRMWLHSPTPSVRRVFDITGTASLLLDPDRGGSPRGPVGRPPGTPPAPWRPVASGDH